jgi:hypothetical protein
VSVPNRYRKDRPAIHQPLELGFNNQHRRRSMKIVIDINAIADEAREDYRISSGADGPLRDAPMAEISDYVMFAVGDYLRNIADELEQQLQDVVETVIVQGPTS